MTKLTIQASCCKLGAMEDELFHDRAVGIDSNKLREKLLNEADLDLNRALQIYLATGLARYLENLGNLKIH